MKYRTFILFFLILGLFSLNSAFAEAIPNPGANPEPAVTQTTADIVAVDTAGTVSESVSSSEEVCGFEVPEEKVYSAQVVAVRRKLHVETGEVFRVKVFLKNTGNMPWFSNESTCLGPKMSLGTERDRDRESPLYTPMIQGIVKTNWEGANRVGMDQKRIDPEEIASFTFWSAAPMDEDVIKEYFAPVLKDIQWIDNSQFSFELMVGDVDENPTDLRKKMLYANFSGSVLDINLNGEQLLKVDLSEQQLYVYLDDQLIRIFRLSTGKASTPTPVGETKIILKQEVRVGGEPPHYIMPKYMMFRAGGYGFHALPSLGGDGGVFWTEARNHIGIPVSHGCIRLLPEDADFLFEFTDVGTAVSVQR